MDADTKLRRRIDSLDARSGDALAPGMVFSFLPADGGARASAVSEHLSRGLVAHLGSSVLLVSFDGRSSFSLQGSHPMRRLDGRTWGAFISEEDGLQVLDASEVQPGKLQQLLEFARHKYAVVCTDLTGVKPVQAVEMLSGSDCIFLVAGSDPASIEGVREKAAWLGSMDLGERCGLLLRRSANGAGSQEAEELTGVPVCSLIETDEQLAQLAWWLAASQSHAAEHSLEFAGAAS